MVRYCLQLVVTRDYFYCLQSHHRPVNDLSTAVQLTNRLLRFWADGRFVYYKSQQSVFSRLVSVILTSRIRIALNEIRTRRILREKADCKLHIYIYGKKETIILEKRKKQNAIHYFHVSNNALYLPPKILHKHCFQFLLGRLKGGISCIPWCIASYYIVKLPNARDHQFQSKGTPQLNNIGKQRVSPMKLSVPLLCRSFTIFVLLLQIYVLLTQRKCFGRRYWLTCRPITRQSTQMLREGSKRDLCFSTSCLTCVDKALHGFISDFHVLVLKWISVVCVRFLFCCLFVIAVPIVSSITHRCSEYINGTVTILPQQTRLI